MKKYLILLVIVGVSLSSLFEVPITKAQVSSIRTIIFPVIGKVSYYDDFGNARDGHTHEGNDLMGKKMLPLVAAVDGTISLVNYPEATWGYSVTIRDSDGYRYNYLHMNNDTPGTDDGKGDGMNAYAPDVKSGNKVVKGQLIGYMGDSGNAEGTTAHLHFEIRMPDGTPLSPYQSLQNATKIAQPVTDYPQLTNEILPFNSFDGGVHVAAANLDGDSNIEYVAGAGPSGGPLVKAFDKDGTQVSAFYAYDNNFTGGVDVATADVDGDGKSEIITAAGPSGGPHIKIFKTDGTLVSQFFAYDTKFRGGVNISAADIDGDGKSEIITGPGAGGGPHVKVFSSDGILKQQLFAYDAGFHGGVDVAAIPSTSSRNTGGFVTAPGKGGGPHVKTFDPTGILTNQFFAFDGNFNLGLRVAVGNADSGNSGSEIGVMPASGGGPNAKLFSISGTELYSNFVAFESWWRGGYDIALYDGGGTIGSLAGRRSSLRQTTFSSQNNNNNYDNDNDPCPRYRRSCNNNN